MVWIDADMKGNDVNIYDDFYLEFVDDHNYEEGVSGATAYDLRPCNDHGDDSSYKETKLGRLLHMDIGNNRLLRSR